MSNRSLQIPSDMSTPELVQRARQFLTTQCEGRQGHVADYCAATEHLREFVGQIGVDRVNEAVSRAVREMADEGFSMEDLDGFVQDSRKNCKVVVEKMEEVLKHTAVVDTYLGEGGSLPAVVPAKVGGCLRRTWACVRRWLFVCRSAGAVVGEEPDSAVLSHDTRLVVDDKAPVPAPVSAPIDLPVPDHPQEQTQAPQSDNTAPMEPTPQASVEQ